MNRASLVAMLKDWGVAFGIVLLVFVVWSWATAPRAPALGPAPDFDLPRLDGARVTRDALDDDLLVLNFWFTSCAPCRHEIPELSAYHAEHPEVALVGVSVDRGMPIARLAAMSQRLGITYPVVHDADASVAARYGVNVFPTTILVRDGEIVASRVGEVDRRSLARMVALSSGR